jgi:ABC-type polar amino acid transport system ATPase subunit
MLKAVGLHKSYDKRVAILDGVDVELRPGTITALLGSNGCGKSTLLRALALIETTDRGAVVLEGTKYDRARVPAAGPQPWPAVTVVFQQLFLWPHLTVRGNIELPQSQLRDPDASRRFRELADIFDIAALVDRYPNELSLGQRQRVALARALAVRPQYLLLDEVTSALDIEHVTALLAYLKALRSEGLGMLLVTHLIGFARDAADRVLFMSRGRIVEQGDAGILSAPESPELRRFLSVLESAESVSLRSAAVRAS